MIYFSANFVLSGIYYYFNLRGGEMGVGCWGRENDIQGNLPSAVGLPKCWQKPGLGHAKARNLEFTVDLSSGGRDLSIWASTTASQGQQEQQAGSKSQRWECNEGVDVP